MNNFKPLNSLSFCPIVNQKVTHTSWIECEWTDGERGCCEVWKFESENIVISPKRALELASADGWINVCGKAVCGYHINDVDDEEISDLDDMVRYLSDDLA